MHSTFAHEIAIDRQALLLHEGGVDRKSSPKMAEIAASERAEVAAAAARRVPRSFSPAGRLGLALVARRSARLAGV